MRTLTVEQLSRLFEQTRGHRLQALWVLLATSGLRLGEALGLKWRTLTLIGPLGRSRRVAPAPWPGLVLVESKTARSIDSRLNPAPCGAA
jgi:integrase